MKLRALSPFSPLRAVLDDILRAIDAELYYPGLLVALTIPEICSALALDNSVFIKEKHYVDFIDRYTTPRELGLAGLDCYRLRGGVVHRGNMAGHPNFAATHVIFSLPKSPAKIHAMSMVHTAQNKTAAMLDLSLFCGAMIRAAERWYEDHHHEPKVIENMQNLIRYRQMEPPPSWAGSP
jgi:hypothetical protein